MKPEFSIIIPTKDRGAIFYRTLAATLEAIKNLNGEIIVVNDSDKALDIKPHPSVHLTKNPKKGVASGRNHGASLAKSDLIIFMDDDFLIDEEALRIVIRLSREHPDRIYLLNWDYLPDTLERMQKTKFGRYLIHNEWTSLKGWAKADNWNDKDPFKVKNGASYFLPIFKSCFFKLGGYNEQFPFAGAEDHDFCQRYIKAGGVFYIYPQKIIYHNESDRVELEAFLERRKRGAVTHKLAAELGYKELELTYNKTKKQLYTATARVQFLLLKAANALPNNYVFDKLYFKLVNTLIAVKIYEGYTKSGR